MFKNICHHLFLKSFYLYIFRERGREGEREGEKHQRVVASHVPHTGDPASNPGMCPDWELNWRPFGSQAGTQSTELHPPGLSSFTTVYLCESYFLDTMQSNKT